jgi:flagella basal body P-ring formation protein FlgA
MKFLLTFLLIISIHSPAFCVEKKTIDDAVSKFIVNRLENAPAGLSISIDKYPQAILSLPGDTKVYVEGNIPARLRKRIPLKIYAFDAKENQIFTHLTAILSIRKEVLCSSVLINRDDEFTTENCFMTEADVIDFQGNPVTDLNELSGRRATKNLNGGKVIDLNDSEPIPEVLRGEKVKIVAKIGNLKVVAQGIARQDGCSGDVIKIKNCESGKTISGEVVTKGIVEVMAIR